MLRGKRVLLGVCGSIAAYKAAVLVRLLIKSGAEVKVIMTPAARDFITPLTLSALSKNPVLSGFTEGEAGEWNNHIDLGLWADVMVIAPATANTMAKLANGICKSLLDAVYLSARCPVIFAPAMDLDMYRHPVTVANIQKLLSYGNHLIDAEHGELASGLIGQGRMPEPENILQYLIQYFDRESPLKGKKILITAGPTHEAIDPVRFIGNHSSGKMGYAIAEEAANLGGDVVLVSGPSTQKIDHPSVHLIRISSAEEMLEHCQAHYKDAHIAILAAAVADYRPGKPAEQKIKKAGDTMVVDLVKNPDIAVELGKAKTKKQFTVGFALETENERENAKDKLLKKNFDMIVLNSLKDEGAGFSGDTNKVTIIDRNNIVMDFELKSKPEVAKDILKAIITRYEN